MFTATRQLDGVFTAAAAEIRDPLFAGDREPFKNGLDRLGPVHTKTVVQFRFPVAHKRSQLLRGSIGASLIAHKPSSLLTPAQSDKALVVSREPIAISEQPKTEFSRSHGRRFALIGATMIGTVAILWIGGASLVAYQLTHPPFLREGRTNVYGRNVPTSYDALPRDPREAFNVEFNTIRVPVSRNRAIDGWLTPGRLPAAVLLVPPVGGSRRMMLPYAKFLHEAGYPTLAIDSGADANSGITWGWRERMAVLSAASELRRQGFEQRAALGVSEGAAEILLVQAAGASFAAIVADSSYGNLEKMFRRVPSIAGLNPALRQTALWETGLLIGHPLWKISPEQAAANLG